MKELQEHVAAIKQALGRLSAREQLMVAGGAAGMGLLLLIIVGVLITSAIGNAEHRIAVKTETLTQVLQLQGAYKAKQAEQRDHIRRLRKRSKVRLVKLVEDAARLSGVEIGRLIPEEGTPNDDGVLESRVQLRTSGLSIDRLQDFLSRLENSDNMVTLRRLKVTRAYRTKSIDVDMTVTTFKIKS